MNRVRDVVASKRAFALGCLCIVALCASGCVNDAAGGTKHALSVAEVASLRDCSAASALHFDNIQDFLAANLHHSPRSYTPLSIEAMNALIEATRALDAADLTKAADAAQRAGYRVAPLVADSTCYWVLEPPGFPDLIEQALLIFASAWRRNLVIEAPHARDDHNTGSEAGILFTNLGAKAVVISGAWRCVQGVESSGCHPSAECSALDRNTGVHPRIAPAESDPSHSIHNALYAMHLGLRTSGAVMLQIHTNFHPEINRDAMVSNGTKYAIPGTAADALYAALQAPDIDIKSCNDPERPVQGAFCGETTTESLASNGAADPCLGRPSSTGNAAAHRFIHLEQATGRLCRPEELMQTDGGAQADADAGADSGTANSGNACLETFETWAERISAALKTAIPITH